MLRLEGSVTVIVQISSPSASLMGLSPGTPKVPPPAKKTPSGEVSTSLISKLKVRSTVSGGGPCSAGVTFSFNVLNAGLSKVKLFSTVISISIPRAPPNAS